MDAVAKKALKHGGGGSRGSCYPCHDIAQDVLYSLFLINNVIWV